MGRQLTMPKPAIVLPSGSLAEADVVIGSIAELTPAMIR